jgi:hypothetical protein
MPSKFRDQGADTIGLPQHFIPPSARELRAQAVERLQGGLFGLAAIVLLVGLANIINDRARMAEAESGTRPSVPAASASPEQNDPLADIGVVPSGTAGTGAANAAADKGN